MSDSVRYNLSDSLNLTCKIDSYPLKYPKWIEKSDIQSQSESRISTNSRTITTNSFIISSLKRSDNGTYICCVRNESDNCKSIEVIVQSRPSKPMILNSTYNSRLSLIDIKWDLEDEGDSEMNLLGFEINSSFFNNYSSITLS